VFFVRRFTHSPTCFKSGRRYYDKCNGVVVEMRDFGSMAIMQGPHTISIEHPCCEPVVRLQPKGQFHQPSFRCEKKWAYEAPIARFNRLVLPESFVQRINDLQKQSDRNAVFTRSFVRATA
jgi:hypothetical protein